MMEHRNLDLKVHGTQAAGYSIEAVGPRGEQASGSFDWTQLADLAPDLASIRAGVADQATLERVGTTLFRALFPQQVLRVYDSVRPGAGENRGLRLRLHLPPELALLPWELLHDQSLYLSFDPRCPIIRFLDLPDTPSPLSTQPPLRLLHLVASPKDAQPLNVEKEARLLNLALAELVEQDLVKVLPGQPGTLETLRQGLRRGCHVLHFSGHGGRTTEGGYLLFQDEAGGRHRVDCHTLAHLLRGSQVRLAVLNACESALATDIDAFASVAAALVRTGLPAVIAHQCPLPDTSATLFAAEFYRALADGLPVDGAVCEGRKALLSELGRLRWDRVDWAAPVLFLQSPDGRILTLDRSNGRPRIPNASVAHYRTTVNVGSIHGGVVNIGAIGGSAFASAGGSDSAWPGDGVQQPGDRLPSLLSELGQKIRVLAPREKQPLAREQVASLEHALTGDRLDPSALAKVWDWFRNELPSLSGATLSVIREAKPLAVRQGEATLDEYQLLFDEL
jgi:hypothetical protein